MARRPPGTEQEYREVLKLLESGHSQPAIGDITGIPQGTVGKWATELLHAGVWNSAEKTVDWSAFETWALQKFRSDRRRPKTTKAHEKPTPSPRKAHELTVKQVEALRELADWWIGRKAQGATTDSLELQPTDYPRKAHDVPTQGPRSRRHLMINDRVWEAIQEEAETAGMSVGELVNRVLKAYVEPHKSAGEEQ